ncbi:hypothetical protein LX36DRAFT_705390 [Colletotrichum falcatum]|nr:hypothetical protein LX36DRAFT_705390 [Colletotrichum falcatum]
MTLHGLIADEGHALKNPQSLAYSLLDKMERRFFWILTATPTVSGIRDLYGYLLAFWDGAFGYNTAAALEQDHLEIIYSDEDVNAFKERDKTALSDLGVPFDAILWLTEVALAQQQATGLTPREPSARQAERRKHYRAAMEAGVPLADIAAPNALISQYSNDMFTPPPKNILPTVGGAGDVNKHDKPRVNMAAMRNASLVSTDLRFATLTDPSRRLARATMDAAGASKLQSLGGASLSNQAKRTSHADRKTNTREGLVDTPNDEAQTEMQAARLERAKVEDNTIGCPTDPVTLARYVISKSPKMAWCLKHAFELQKEGQRCLFYTINPLTAINLWRKLPQRLPAQSHLGNCPNFGLQCQVIGRLWRLSQKQKVVWKILQTQDTFDPWIETRNMRAYGSWRTVCAFEILRMYIGAGYNHYPRVWRPWNHFSREEVQKEGYLFSAVAQWLIAHPEDANAVANMSDIAKRWNSTMAMTKDIVTGRAPELSTDEWTKFNCFTAVDPRLENTDERAALFEMLGI